MRVLHETDIYNTWYVKERSIDHPIVEFEDVKKKFMDQVTLMENRQKMESDALFAEQVKGRKDGLNCQLVVWCYYFIFQFCRFTLGTPC